MPLATRLRRILPVLVGLAVAATAGCGEQQQQQQQSSRLKPAHPLQPIRYARTGGLAGTSDQLTISPDGVAVAKGTAWGDRSGHLTAEQSAALAAAFDGWDTVRRNYPPVPGVTDAFDLSLTYGDKTVTATDVSDVPETFQRAQALLEELIRQMPLAAPARPGPTTSRPAGPTSRGGLDQRSPFDGNAT